MFTPLLKSLQNNEELIHWKNKKNPEGLVFLELSRGCSEKSHMTKTTKLKGEDKDCLKNMIGINVYFGYKFFVIKILSVHGFFGLLFFYFFLAFSHC